MGGGPLKVLTVRQPWATLVVSGRKNIENRSWNTNYRGALAIHAGLGVDNEGVQRHRSLLPDELPHGCVLGVVELVNVVTKSTSEWAEPGMYHWVLGTPRFLDRPIPATGKLGLWQPDMHLAGQLRDQGVA